jgi:uncharacterized membrane protein (DUF2068 family)
MFRRLDFVSVFGWNILRWAQWIELVSVSMVLDYSVLHT